MVVKGHRVKSVEDLGRHPKWKDREHHQGSISDEEYVLRMLAAEESDHDVSYHITDNPHFTLDPTKVPEDNALSIRPRTAPGLYTTKDPERWVNGHNYVRPYVAEIHTPKGAMHDQRWGGEGFIPAEHFDKAKVHRVIPLDAHARERFHESGWIEAHHGTAFDTGKPVDDYTKFPDYKYPGPDVRDMSPQQHQQHHDRWKKYMVENRGFASEDFDDTPSKTASLTDEEYVMVAMAAEESML
jgi:hypothetical protein